MNKFKLLQLKMLDKYLMNISVCERPTDGWIRSIRRAIGMSTRQLAERIGITQQSTFRLEENELDYSITLKTLRRVAEALDCRLVYAIIPNDGCLEDTVRKQAYKKSKAIVEPVNHTMILESQGFGNLEEKIKETAQELSTELNSKLWDN